MKLIERYVDEIEPGDIVALDGRFYPVMMIKRDIFGQVELNLCTSLEEDEECGTYFEIALLVNDTLFVAIDDEDEEHKNENEL